MRTRSSGKVYEVDRILDRKLDDNNDVLYQVRWKGCGPGEDSWRSSDELINAGSAIEEYEKNSGDRVAEEEVEGQEGQEGPGAIEEGKEDKRSSNQDEGRDKETSRKRVGKVAHFAGNVEKKEQRIVGGKWQTVFEDLKG